MSGVSSISKCIRYKMVNLRYRSLIIEFLQLRVEWIETGGSFKVIIRALRDMLPDAKRYLTANS